MKFKAIIFDLDGVICFTDEYHYQAWKALADSIDVPFDRTVNNRLRGVSRMASLEIILENAPQKYTPEEKEAFATKKNDLYRELLKNMSEKNLDERTKDVLTILRQRGYLLAIGSSSKNTPFILERIGLDHFFDVVVDGNCIQHSKPDPEVFLTAAERLHVAPVDCLVVEDAISGAEAGHAVHGPPGHHSAGLGQLHHPHHPERLWQHCICGQCERLSKLFVPDQRRI